MIPVKGYAAQNSTDPLDAYSFERREVGPLDVLINIEYCGICHSDLHQVRNEWGNSNFPMVPGHEMVGKVEKVGSQVTRFKVGDLAGVGCFVDSCGECSSCKEDLEQFCEIHTASSYNGFEMDKKTPTYGGYSNKIVTTEKFVLKLPPNLDLARVAPLLCAGITTYSPLRHYGLKQGDRIGVIGLGGLGHMAVKMAAAMGAEVTVLSTSPSKEVDAKQLGAHHFQNTKNLDQIGKLSEHFDFIIDTVSAPHDYNFYINLLKRDGTMILVGAPPEPSLVSGFGLLLKRRKLGGSLVGGIAETQEMLDFCGQHNIMSDIEIIPMKEVNRAYERLLKSDVKYRFVIDMKTL